ncbi:peptidoglycan editing factor PgeF [bacterium]|nr:peptidoglycan editing factor PgeF [bacterium]
MFINTEIFKKYKNIIAGFSGKTDLKTMDRYQERLFSGGKGFKIINLKQAHTDNVVFYPGYSKDIEADAIITNQKKVILTIRTADCIPILIFDPSNNVIAAVHAGWRGTKSKILKKTVELMCEKYGCDKEKILFSIGPSNRKCCYDVKKDLYDIFTIDNENYKDFFSQIKDDLWRLDILGINLKYLIDELNISEKQIEIVDICTFCTPYFFSSRRDKSDMRNIAFISLQ